MSVVLIISTFLSLFLAILVFLKKGKTYPDFLLSLWLLFTAFHSLLLYVQFYNTEHDYPFPYIIGTDISLIVVHPIWIFIYILSFVHPKTKSLTLLWHLLPLVFINLVLLKTFYLRSEEEKIASLKSAVKGAGYIDKSLELTVFMVISFAVAYLIASFWLLRKHRKNVKNYYSTIDGIDLKWLQRILYSIVLVIVVNTVLEWIRNYMNIIPPGLSISIGHIFIILGVSYVGIYGIRQTKIFVDFETDDFAENLLNKNVPNSFISKTDNSLPKNSFNEDYEKLFRFMKENKPFQDSTLNLFTLAGQLGFNTRYLSQLVNQKAGKNFFDFVNHFRINEFKNRVRQPENQKFTLLSIAYDCGFNSKATFNRVFKNHTGNTPSEFFNNPNLD